MASCKLLALCLSCVLCGSFFFAKRALLGSIGKSKEYDGFFLSVRNNGQSLWVIHGLWPGVVGCKGGPDFDDTKIAPSLKQELEVSWPNNQVGGVAKDFWRHEYGKHGRCCVDLLPDSLQYVSKTLELWKPLQLHEVMGLDVPLKPNVYYPTAIIEAHIFSKYGVNVILRCLANVLIEVYFCVSKQFKMESCLNTDLKYYCAAENVYFESSLLPQAPPPLL